MDTSQEQDSRLENLSQKKSPRKTWVINPKLQYRLIFIVGILALGVVAFFFILFSAFISNIDAQVRFVGGPDAPALLEYIQMQRTQMGLYMLGGLAFLVTIFSILGLRETNRIAGPIFNLTRRISALRAGEKIEPVQFRKNDYFPELADEFNGLLENFQKQD